MGFDFDVLILGNNKASRRLARALDAQKKKVGLLGEPDGSSEVFEETITQLGAGPVRAEPEPDLPSSIERLTGSFSFGEKKKKGILNEREVSAPHFVVSTGARIRFPASAEKDNTAYLTPLDVIQKKKIKGAISVWGSGPVAVRLCEILLDRGCRPTLLSDPARVLSQEEPELRSALIRSLQDKGVMIQEAKEQKKSKTPVVLAHGFCGNTDGWGLEKQGAYCRESGQLVVNDLLQTAEPSIWGLGAVTGPPFHMGLFAHQGELLANNLTAPFFSQKRLEAEAFPVFRPFRTPLAKVGLGEKEAKEKFTDIKVHLEKKSESEWIKIIGRERSGDVVGVHILAAEADEMILYFNLAKRAGISLYDLLDRHHYPHPRASESLYTSIKNWTTDPTLHHTAG